MTHRRTAFPTHTPCRGLAELCLWLLPAHLGKAGFGSSILKVKYHASVP